MDDRPVALVTDAERGSAVAAIRSLDAAGWHVIAAAADHRAPGLRSRSAASALVHADPTSAAALVAEQLADAATASSCALVFPMTDQMVHICQRAALPERTVLAAAPHDAYEMASDKWRTVESAQRLGIPVPRSTLAGSRGDVDHVAAQLGWPVVLKPRWSVTAGHEQIERHSVSVASSAGELSRLLTAMPETDVVVQSFHEGAGVGVELLLDQGRVIAAFQHRRIREYPLRGGPSTLRIGEALDPDLLRWSSALLEELSWTGLAMVEFKVGPDGPSLMEINARPWGSLPLATRSGVDFPALAAEVHMGHGPAPVAPTYRVGVRSRDLRLELMWIAAVLRGARANGVDHPPRGEAVRAALRLALPGDGYDVLSARDLGASIADVRQAVRHLAKKTKASL